MTIFLAVLSTPRQHRAFAATTNELLSRAVYEEFLDTAMEGVYDEDEGEVRRLANAGQFSPAVQHWIDTISILPSVGARISGYETSIRGVPPETATPEEISVFLIADQSGVAPIPTVNEDATYAEIFESYVIRRLGSAGPEEIQVRDLADRGRHREAVHTWFSAIGPRYFEGEDAGCEIFVLEHVPLRTI